MNRIVVDASIALAWAFPDETDPYAQTVLRSLSSRAIVVPSHWILEVVNAILSAERKGRISRSDSTRVLTFMNNLPITVDDRTTDTASTASLSLARDYKLTLYDAAYLELALREGIPLASLDKDLVVACTATGGQLA